MESNPLFSVIIPIFNAEKYLDESIQSVCGQSIGFLENIEIILVNDGSTDASEEICKKYIDQYPKNIKYFYQKNAGVSAARNKGLEYACGEIIAFLDADDKYAKNAFKSVAQYFRIVHDYVDVAVIRVLNFGAQKTPHYLDKKFSSGLRTLKLENAQWFDVCTRVGQAFIRSKAAKSVQFDTKITYFEDTKYINTILIDKMRLGIVPGGVYYYRRYPSETRVDDSLTLNAAKNKRLYLETPERVTLALLEDIRVKEAPTRYFQFLALAEMRWRTFYTGIPTTDVLNCEEYSQYQTLRKKILSYISDDTIANAQLYNFWQKLYLLAEKNDVADLLGEVSVDSDTSILWRSWPLFNLNEQLQVNILDYEFNEKKLIIEFFLPGFIIDKIDISVCCNGKYFGAEKTGEISPTAYPLCHETYKYYKYNVMIPLDEARLEIAFYFTCNGQIFKINNIFASKQGDYEIIKRSFLVYKKHILMRRKSSIKLYRLNLENIFIITYKLLKNRNVRNKAMSILKAKMHIK